MGFYGKVNRTDRVSFTIDKVYSNRKEMEDTLKNGDDKIAIGRYVLIDYDGVGEQYPRLYAKVEKNNKGDEVFFFYFSRDMEEDSRAKFLSEEEYRVVIKKIQKKVGVILA